MCGRAYYGNAPRLRYIGRLFDEVSLPSVKGFIPGDAYIAGCICPDNTSSF